jgi:hypothetical protein
VHGIRAFSRFKVFELAFMHCHCEYWYFGALKQKVCLIWRGLAMRLWNSEISRIIEGF